MKVFQIFDKSFKGPKLLRSILEILNEILTDDEPTIVVKVKIDQATKRIFEIDKAKF